MTEVERFSDADRFAEEVSPFLIAREAEHNLLLGILAGLRDPDGPYRDADPYLACVRNPSGGVALVAVRTPPRNLVLSTATGREAVAGLVASMLDEGVDVPGVTGPTDLAVAFAQAWGEATGRTPTKAMAMRVFRADSARLPEGVPGRLRAAEEADRVTVNRWAQAFQEEALGETPAQQETEEWTDHMLRRSPERGLYLWDDGRPVSMAAYLGPTPTGIRIAAVYTPRDLRRRGYGTACVAALTRLLLDSGRRFCFLFTDLANPTSNAIYRRVGYEAVIDVDDYRFAEA